MSAAPAPPSAAELRQLALTAEEYSSASLQLGRSPNSLELGMVAAMWSEHCSYKTSRPLLRQLGSRGPGIVLGPGENAGGVDLGDGLVCCFKIESHNHPSAVEPVQGAATGVGGILRDVFALGARPVALLDGIRFGELGQPLQRHRLARVVEGVGFYGNCVGVPTVGGETYFDSAYGSNCLVNAMCVGLVERSQMVHAAASGVGNQVVLVGADTGRDGIQGATFASLQLDGGDRRPAVQVGNPFLEKCLMEACLELAASGVLVALQDCGAAGLTSSCAELAHRGGVGIELDVARVSRRESGMGPYEVVLSESQERMVLVVERGREEEVGRVFDRWELHSDVIGEVVAEPCLRVLEDGAVVADLPLGVLVDGYPERRPPHLEPPELASLRARDPLQARPPWTLEESWLRLLGSPNCGERRWIFRQYDHQVGDDTLVGPGRDAAVIRIRGRRAAIAVVMEGAHRSSALDPRRGVQLAMAEAVSNLAVVGAEPLALTNCLNFGDPDRPQVMWQLEEAVAGLAEAGRRLGLPVVSGNVSLYNDFRGVGIPPTPVLGVVGRLEDPDQVPGPGFRDPGDVVLLVGEERFELAGSEYQRLAHGPVEGNSPELDFDAELAAAAAVRELVLEGSLRSAHDCALGGLAVALAECCIAGERGATVEPPPGPTSEPPGWRWGVLFGEAPGRYLVSTRPEGAARVMAACRARSVPCRQLGEVGGSSISISGLARISLEAAAAAWRGALPSAMEPA